MPKYKIGDKVKGKVTGIVFKKCVSVFDEFGKFNPKYDENDSNLSAGSDNDTKSGFDAESENEGDEAGKTAGRGTDQGRKAA